MSLKLPTDQFSVYNSFDKIEKQHHLYNASHFQP